jgi:hypothetical protein
MKVESSNGFVRDISRIRNQSIRERIEKAIEQIERIDNFAEASNIKKTTCWWKPFPHTSRPLQSRLSIGK